MGDNQNINVSPFLAVQNKGGFNASGVGDVEVPVTPVTGKRTFVSGAQWSYSLPPAVSATSGLLVIGRYYVIQTFVAGDSFTNVGAASNANGVVFQATHTTPTTWSNGSTLTSSGGLNIATLIGDILHDIDITQDGPGAVYFRPALLIDQSTIFTLLNGGAGCVGKLNLLGVARELD